MKKITDLWFAAFLKSKGYELADFELKHRGKGVYIFEIEDEEYKKLRLEFFKSEISKIKQIMEELKDLAF